MQVNFNPSVNYQRPQFKAVLEMPTKEVFEKHAGKFCAEQIEKARPAIEKLAKAATEIEIIDVRPTYIKGLMCKPSIYISAYSKRGDVAGWPRLEPSDARTGQSFSEFLVETVKEAIRLAKDGDWLS